LFFQATVAGVLESQIAQSPFLTQDEKRMALTQQNIRTGQETKTTLSRAILVRIRQINTHTEHTDLFVDIDLSFLGFKYFN